MALRLSIPEFGGPIVAPIVNSDVSGTPRIDAGWFVDFDTLPGSVDLEFTAIVKADTFAIAPAKLQLWASKDPASIAGATLLAELDLPATTPSFTGEALQGTFPNPGGKKHLLLTSSQGVG